MSINTISSSIYAPIVTKSSTTSNSPDIITSPSTSDNTISTKWGFKVDENGFFGIDFNEAAGIPPNVKIHQNQLEMAETYAKAIGSNDDPLTALSKVWSFFAKVAGSSLDPDGSMTIEQVDNMPLSFQSNGSLLDDLVSVQKSWEETQKVTDLHNDIGAMSDNTLNSGLRGFFGGLKMWDPDGEQTKGFFEATFGVQYDPDGIEGELGVGELFGCFCAINLPEGRESIEKIRSYYALVESGQDFRSYLTDKFGSEYVKQLADKVNTMPDGKVIPDMFDMLLQEIDRHMRDDYASYLSGQNSIADFVKDNTNSSAYQSAKSTKLPSSGSLISIGA